MVPTGAGADATGAAETGGAGRAAPAAAPASALCSGAASAAGFVAWPAGLAAAAPAAFPVAAPAAGLALCALLAAPAVFGFCASGWLRGREGDAPCGAAAVEVAGLLRLGRRGGEVPALAAAPAAVAVCAGWLLLSRLGAAAAVLPAAGAAAPALVLAAGDAALAGDATALGAGDLPLTAGGAALAAGMALAAAGEAVLAAVAPLAAAAAAVLVVPFLAGDTPLPPAGPALTGVLPLAGSAAASLAPSGTVVDACSATGAAAFETPLLGRRAPAAETLPVRRRTGDAGAPNPPLGGAPPDKRAPLAAALLAERPASASLAAPGVFGVLLGAAVGAFGCATPLETAFLTGLVGTGTCTSAKTTSTGMFEG